MIIEFIRLIGLVNLLLLKLHKINMLEVARIMNNSRRDSLRFRLTNIYLFWKDFSDAVRLFSGSLPLNDPE